MAKTWLSWRGWWALGLLVAVAACGGSGGPGGPGGPGGGPDAIFAGRAPYAGPLPEGARVVELEEFRQIVTREGVVWDSLERREAADRAASEQFAADRAAVEQLVSQDPSLARVLETPDPDDPDVVELPGGEYLVTVRGSDGTPFQVLTRGQQDTFREFLAARGHFPTKENQLELYATAFASLPEGVQVALPSPAQLASGSADAVTEAFSQLSGAVAGLLEPPDVAAMALPSGYPASPADELGAHGQRQDWRVCGRSSFGLYDSFDWPLKHFQTSIKDQGNRGTCTAFALAAAVESITAMTQGAWVNISEQHLYYQSRGIWQPNDTANQDGFMYANVPLGGGGYRFRAEQQWSYNRSMARFVTSTGFGNSCNGYGEVCSDAVHQGESICVHVNGNDYCILVGGQAPSSSAFDFTGIPFPDLRTILWEESQEMPIPLDLVRYYLQTGHPILTSLRADSRFRNPTQGFVGTSAGFGGGGHVVLMVGFISAEAILAHPTRSNDLWLKARTEESGGGFFIVKNSWGCSGDGGYLYIPVAWAEQQFERLRLPKRGPAPAFDSYVASLAPGLAITSPANGSSFFVSPLLNVRLTAFTDPPDCCDVTWVSNVDGPLGSGQQIDADFGTAGPGPRTITATATRGDGKTSSTSITIHLTTTAPNVSIVYPPGGELFRGLAYTFVAEEFSGANPSQPCSAYAWTSSLPGEGPWSGCAPALTFATLGPRTITLSVENPYGQVGSDEVDVDVVEPPDDGPPVVSITSPTVGAVFSAGQRAYVAYSVVDPSPLPPASVAWSISYGVSGERLPITLSTDTRPFPGAPSTRWFRPSDYVTPLCFHSGSSQQHAYRVWLTYTNADDRSATTRVSIYLDADPSSCIN